MRPQPHPLHFQRCDATIDLHYKHEDAGAIFVASFLMEWKPHPPNLPVMEFPAQIHHQTFYLMPSATNDTTINQVHPREEMVRRGLGVAGGSGSNYWRNSALSPTGILFKNVSKLPPNHLPDAISNKNTTINQAEPLDNTVRRGLHGV